MNNDLLLAKFISAASAKCKSCSYKMVYGVLEEDMKKSENNLESLPTRAFLDDLEYGLKPLPENIRRLIYIVDRTGYTAPRGAKLLLRYNPESGFYEPVTKQQYIVMGKIDGNSATVDLSYMPGYKAGDGGVYKSVIKFNNPLELNYKNKNGIFLYDNANWNLISVG